MDTTKLFPSGDEVNAMHHSIFDGIDDEDGFEATIERLQKLRGIAESLPDAERHSLAAQVGLAFLKQFDADVRVNANGQESMDKDLQM